MVDIENKKRSPQMTVKLLGCSTLYMCSSQGILNVFQIIICYTCVLLMSDACRPAYGATPGGFVGTTYDTYFYISSYACFIITNIVLWCFIFSQPSYALVGRTILIFIFWMVCAAISMGASILLLMSITYPYSRELQIVGYTNKVASSALGVFNGILYATSCLQAYRTCKNSSLGY